MAVAGGKLSESSRIILEVVRSHTNVSQKEIVEATGLSLRTVKYVLELLLVLQMIREIVFWEDLRKKRYEVKNDCK